ncbi:STM4015 family protein [Actinoallomurus sp. CA-150999]|uniref:STM4015 family protein n=1 Tax=Actinoallomurus sp. CA-150999 TaxID=3239887 RepID=UPI003D8C9CBB
MGIMNRLQEFHGLPVFDFPASVEDPQDAAGLPTPESVAWRISVMNPYEGDDWEVVFGRFLAAVDTSQVRALIVGCWGDPADGPEEAIKLLVAAHDRLPALRALFLGDITEDLCQISHIIQGEVTPLLDAFTELEEFGVRGQEELSFPAVRHERLRKLVMQTSAMPVEVVRGVAASDLPALEHLELWLGASEWGGHYEVADLAPILAGTRLPALKHLALRNSELQDDICKALATAPIVARLDELDLSMGELTDDGVTALVAAGQSFTHLKSLDLSHNFLSTGMRTYLKELPEWTRIHINTDPDDAVLYVSLDGVLRRFIKVDE